jgi:hypothetical protein
VSLRVAAFVALTTFLELSPARADSAPTTPPPDDPTTAAILHEMPYVGTQRAVGDAYAAVARSPQGPGAQHLLVFIGDAERQQDNLDQAAAAYDQAQALGQGTFWGRHATLGAGEVALTQVRLDDADRLFGELLDDPDPTIQNVAFQRAAQSRRQRWERRAAATSAAILVLFVLITAMLILRRAPSTHPTLTRRFWPIPIEVTVEAPVLAVLSGASLAFDKTLTPGLAVLSAAEVAVSWLGAAAAPTLKGRTVRALLYGLLLCAAAAAALYLFAYLHGEIAIIAETIVNGPEG